MAFEYDFQHSFNGSSHGVIDDGEYVLTLKEGRGEFFLGMKLLTEEHVKETVVSRKSDGIVTIHVVYDEAYIDAIGRCKMAEVNINYGDYRYYPGEIMKIDDFSNVRGNLHAGDTFMGDADEMIEVERVFERSIGVTPTIVVFYANKR
jgi:hypothetical protein